MQSLRQIGLAIAVAVVSLGVVLGGLSLALSENVTPLPAATETLWLPTFAEFTTPTSTPEILPSLAPVTITASFTATLLPPPTSCTPPSGWRGVTVGINDTLESMAIRYRTSSQALAQGNCLLTQSLIAGSVLFVPPIPTATVIPCGPPFGWVRYSVQAGDTLYHIATIYGITTSQLQQANCLGFSTNIRIGQLLWVPNRAPLVTNTPGLTLIPTYYLPTTEVPTQAPSDTAVPATSTPQPTEPIVPTATLTPLTPQP